MAYLVVDTVTGDLSTRSPATRHRCSGLPDGAVGAAPDAGGAPLLGIECKRETVAPPASPPGPWLVVYTDGLIERRAEGLDIGIARLVDGRPVGRRADADPTPSAPGSPPTLRQPDAAADDVAIVTVSLDE